MPTTTTKTIGSGGDYSTLQAWEDAAPADLVASDVIWRGEMLNSLSSSGSGSILVMSGSTQDATRYKILTAASGQSFKDNANKLTNALRGNSANGVAITASGNNYGNFAVVMSETYARVDGIQILQTNAGSGGAVQGGNLVDCIVESACAAANASPLNEVLSAVNTLVIFRLGAASSGAIARGPIGTAVSYTNCTFVVPTDKTSPSYGFESRYGAAVNVKNCAIFGATAVISGSGGSFTNCYTNVASPPSGCTQIAYDTSTGSGFEAITDSARDYRIKSTSTLKDNGTATGAPSADIVGSTRSAPIDVGVWEYGAGADTTPPVLTSPTGSATGPTTATVGATTDEANGTLYGVVTTSATQPSVAQIKAGQDHTGAAAVWGGSAAVSATGARTLSATGLAASTGYYGHLVHTDAAANNSNRVSSALFTTPALPALTSNPLKNNTGTLLTSQPFEAYVSNPSTGALVLKKTGLTSHASTAVVTFGDAALTAATSYRVVWRQTSTGAEGLETLTAT